MVPFQVQEIRGGVRLSVIVPVPFPKPETEMVAVPNVAFTFCAALIVTAQVICVEGQTVVDPLTFHCVSVEPALAIATRLTTWPAAKFTVHAPPAPVGGQLTTVEFPFTSPFGLPITDPLPAPAKVTASATPGGAIAVPVTGIEKDGFLGAFVEKVILPLNTVPPTVPGGGI